MIINSYCRARAMLQSIQSCNLGYIVIALAAWLSDGLNATCAEPKVESITPSVFSLGETRTVKILGEGLSSALDLRFYEPGIECLNIKAATDFEAVADIRVTSDADVGSAVCRLLTNDGFSNAKTLRLIDLPLILEPARNADEAAIPIEFGEGIAIYGTLDRGQYDRYVLDLEAGDSCTVVVEAVRLGSNLLDTVIKVYDPNGRLISFVDDTSLYRQEPYLQFSAKTAGNHTVEVHETNYDGSEDSHYLLFIDDSPSPSMIFPPGGQIGQVLHAITVPESVTTSSPFSVEIGPLEASRDGWLDYRVEYNKRKAPTSVRIRSTSFPNVLEAEQNDDPKTAMTTVSSLPVAFCGTIEATRDVDYFAFSADAGVRYQFEVFAERLGSPIDSRISITDAAGAVLVSGDDWMCHDSQLDFTPNRSGTYLLQVTDKLGNGFENGIYRVEATHSVSSVSAFLPRPDRTTQAGQAIAIPRGNRALINMAVRREAIDGPATLKFENLPAGAHVPSISVPADRFWMPIVASADIDAPLDGAFADVKVSVATANKSTNGGFVQEIDLVAGSADTLFYGVEVRRVPVAVVSPVPFKVELEQPKTALSVGGTIDLKVRVVRDPGFSEPITVKFPFLPPWVTCDPEASIPADSNEIIHRLVAHERAEGRNWPMVATAEVDVKNATNDVNEMRGKQVASEIVALTIAQTPLVGKFDPIAAEQGQTIEVVCRCNVQDVVPQKMTAVLEGLPNRVTCEPALIEAGESEIHFTLKIAEDAPVGTFTSVACRLSGELDGQSVSYVVAGETPLQIQEPGKLVRGASGELLSPLEALKQKQLRQ